MAGGIENLRVPTSEQARENGRKGGIASAKAKKERKQMQEVMQTLLDMPMKPGKLSKKIEAFLNIKDANITMREAVAAAMVQAAVQDRNVNAAKYVTEAAGETASVLNLHGELPVVLKDDITEAD